MDLMIGEAENWVNEQWEDDPDNPPDSIKEIKDFGVVQHWDQYVHTSQDDTASASTSDGCDDEDESGDEFNAEETAEIHRQVRQENALDLDFKNCPEEWTQLHDSKMPYSVDMTPEPPRPGEKGGRVTISIYPNSTSPEHEDANTVSVKATTV